jgi:hypothetical protein
MITKYKLQYKKGPNSNWSDKRPGRSHLIELFETEAAARAVACSFDQDGLFIAGTWRIVPVSVF